MDKNYFWLNILRYPMACMSGRRYNHTVRKIIASRMKKQRVYVNRDQAIWATLQGKPFDLAEADAKLRSSRSSRNTCVRQQQNGLVEYPGPQAQTKIEVAEGYKIELLQMKKPSPTWPIPCNFPLTTR